MATLVIIRWCNLSDGNTMIRPYKQCIEQDETMNKTCAAFFVMIIACMTLFGCGSVAKETTGSNQMANIGKTSVKVGDLTISLNDEMKSIRESLGEPLDYVESKSCMYDGYDKIYTYADVEIITYPMNKKEYISSINILTDNAVSGSDIQIGSNANDIVEKYGEENLIISNVYYIYETDKYGYSFCVGNDDIVLAIEVYVSTSL